MIPIHHATRVVGAAVSLFAGALLSNTSHPRARVGERARRLAGGWSFPCACAHGHLSQRGPVHLCAHCPPPREGLVVCDEFRVVS